MRFAVLILAVSGLVAMSGCPGDRRAAVVEEPVVAVLDAPALAERVSRQRGRVVLVEFWATWCIPCLKLLPHTVELQRQYGDRGLTVLTVSLDEVAQLAAVRRVLAGNHALEMQNFLSSYGVGPEAFDAFGIDDGALPHLRLYDAQGKLHRVFGSGGNTVEAADVRRAVESLLK